MFPTTVIWDPGLPTLVKTGPGMAGKEYDGYGGLMNGFDCVWRCGIGPFCSGGEVVEAVAVWGLWETDVELGKPYGGWGAAEALMAVNKLGAEDALDTASAGLIGDVWSGGRRWLDIIELPRPGCCPFWFVADPGEASETDCAY